MHSGSPEAESHMRGAVERLRSRGLEIEGRVGDPDAYAEVQDDSEVSAPAPAG
jgi:hypothetical protein